MKDIPPPQNDHISHLGKKKIIFKSAKREEIYMLVPRRAYALVILIDLVTEIFGEIYHLFAAKNSWQIAATKE